MSDFQALLAFMSESPFLGFLIICSAYYILARSLRCIQIAIRGWPANPLMDADGDIVHPKKDGDDE